MMNMYIFSCQYIFGTETMGANKTKTLGKSICNHNPKNTVWNPQPERQLKYWLILKEG